MRTYDHLIGARIRFISTSDPYSRRKSGTEGTITFVDSERTVHVAWDDGSTLGMIAGEDSWDFV